MERQRYAGGPMTTVYVDGLQAEAYFKAVSKLDGECRPASRIQSVLNELSKAAELREWASDERRLVLRGGTSRKSRPPYRRVILNAVEASGLSAVNLSGAAALFGVSPRTIRGYLSHGIIEPTGYAHGTLLFDVDDLRARKDVYQSLRRQGDSVREAGATLVAASSVPTAYLPDHLPLAKRLTPLYTNPDMERQRRTIGEALATARAKWRLRRSESLVVRGRQAEAQRLIVEAQEDDPSILFSAAGEEWNRPLDETKTATVEDLVRHLKKTK